MSEKATTTDEKDSITLEFRLFGTFRQDVGEKTIECEFHEVPVRVGEILREIQANYDELEILDKDGEIREYISILKNGTHIAHQAGQDTLIDEGDQLSLFPPVAGG